MKKQEVKKQRRTFTKWLDDQINTWAYVGALVALSILSVSGIKFYLQPVDELLANIFSVSFVACVLYIAIRNR